MLALVPPARPVLFCMLPLAPFPALAAALLLPVGLQHPLPSALLGAGLTLGENGRIFMGVGAALWILAGFYAQGSITSERRQRFAGFWLATLAGNMLLFVAADVVSFYLAFAMLSLAGFGLIVHYDTKEARRAARIYLVMAVLGETLLLLGFLIAAQATGTILITDVRETLALVPQRDLAIGLLVAGFGLKAGLMPLHVWLPLAHPAAPVPASAVLSGTIVKAGIFGLISFLPLQAQLSGWSVALVMFGLVTAYGGVLCGVVQQRPKTVLAYSTLSQMGLVIAVLGLALGSPGAGLVLAAVTLYCAHHSLAKGALFLSVGLAEKSGGNARSLLIAVTALAAFAIAGLPFTGGALVKLAIKSPLSDSVPALLVTLSAIGTTLLMLRFLQLLRRTDQTGGAPPALLLLPFLGCVGGALALPWILFPDLTDLKLDYVVSPSNLWSAFWPLIAGAAAMAGGLLLPYRSLLRIPEGDIVVPMERIFHLLANAVRRAERVRPSQLRFPRFPRFDRVEQAFARWPLAGATLLLVCGLMVFASLAP